MTHPHCKWCGNHIKQVIGGQGRIWIHEDGYRVCQYLNHIGDAEHAQIHIATPTEEDANV